MWYTQRMGAILIEHDRCDTRGRNRTTNILSRGEVPKGRWSVQIDRDVGSNSRDTVVQVGHQIVISQRAIGLDVLERVDMPEIHFTEHVRRELMPHIHARSPRVQ